jgi:hypothetical protein
MNLSQIFEIYKREGKVVFQRYEGCPLTLLKKHEILGMSIDTLSMRTRYLEEASIVTYPGENLVNASVEEMISEDYTLIINGEDK